MVHCRAVFTHRRHGYDQEGSHIPSFTHPFGRFEYMKLQGNPVGRNYIPAVTAGVNYYFFGHGAKLTAQATYLPHGIPIDDTANDVLAVPSGRSEITASVQFQLSI